MRNSKYTQEFRDSAVQLIINSDESVSKIAKDLAVNEKTLYNWVGKYKKINNTVIMNTQKDKVKQSKESMIEENRRLNKENRLLKQERDILKKATAYFAKGTL